MTPPLPSLDAPEPGTRCRTCGEEASALVDFCGACHEREMQRLEALIRQAEARADHEAARKRARTWQLGRGVQQ